MLFVIGVTLFIFYVSDLGFKADLIALILGSTLILIALAFVLVLSNIGFALDRDEVAALTIPGTALLLLEGTASFTIVASDIIIVASDILDNKVWKKIMAWLCSLIGNFVGIFLGISNKGIENAISMAKASIIPEITINSYIYLVITIGIFLSLLASINIAKSTLSGKKNNGLILQLAIDFAAIGGTSFRGADLTDADFTNATLKNSDFRGANLKRTWWRGAKKLKFARPGDTYLSQPQIIELVTTGDGENKTYDRLNLQGINLHKSKLQNASFIETNLDDANLQDANLTDARLVHAQLDDADLTGATLTGAYIEEWNITTTTKLNGIRCNYVFMRLPPKDRPAFIALPPEESSNLNPQRKPDDWQKNFEDGEFTDFIAPMRQTLDLYHNRSVDMRLVAIALQQLKDDNPEAEIEVVSMEKKGKNKDKLLIRAETSPQSDHAALNQGYFANLEYVQSLPPEALQALVADRGKIIQLLAGILETKHQSPDINIYNQNQGDQNMSGDRHITTNSYHEDNRNITDNQGTIIENVGRDVNQYAPEQKQDLATAAAEIQKLLEQLEKTYPTDTTTGKMTIATKAIEAIENNPTLMQRILSALKSGGTAALEQLLSHPAASFAIAALEDWQKSKTD